MADLSPEYTVLASAVRAASNQSPEFSNEGTYRGLLMFLNITAVPGVQTITLNIEAQDILTGVWQTYAIIPATAATGNLYILVYPGAVETLAIGNLTVQGLPLPRRWRVNMSHSGAGNFTYSVSAQLLP